MTSENHMRVGSELSSHVMCQMIGCNLTQPRGSKIGLAKLPVSGGGPSYLGFEKGESGSKSDKRIEVSS